MSQEHDISLEKLFTYPLGPILWSIATADGSLVKSNKAQLLHHLEGLFDSNPNPPMENCTYIVDGNAHIQAMSHVPVTFGELSIQIFNSLPKARIVHFVTDSYNDNSIKNFERTRRGSTPEYLVGGPKTKLPRNFKSFLLNSENKKQFIKLLRSEWQTQQYARSLQGRHVFFVCEEECVTLKSYNVIDVDSSSCMELFSSQEEANTRILLHCLYAAQESMTDTNIVVRSPDTDVLIILIICTSSLHMHCLRANYQSYIWKHSHLPYAHIPSPIGNGWCLDEDGYMCIDWTKGDIMPQKLVDVLASTDPDYDPGSKETNYDYEPFENEIEEDYKIDNILDVIFDDDEND